MFFGRSAESPAASNTRSGRRACWDSRDRFFQCLDALRVVDPQAADVQSKVKSECGRERQAFQDSCLHSWFVYFQEKRVADWKKNQYVMKIEREAASAPPQTLSKIARIPVNTSLFFRLPPCSAPSRFGSPANSGFATTPCGSCFG
ncbi:Coa6p KNAG_0J00580 [Huiozyma naganishii CBS 8797]|uniref:Cytochrome c oxidase assembly factor 6 n=1 Tax=Huiozyma naganishii (strain ATCC MYA-139 / BCRC 22969 / CBS 8797 / KCTC 17520 / NBRC 10181 / NCYC 3082 / Yp74L-3) TaxID=1071383 RepID=J7SAG3_HUIN7|nr:hypothetical protein KNAG_0J00580 [Kazachstania naganishii CBS 8797]CCK72141.1 hypothetical protein KNAG_0J00580 [Kazachstania naganishii CBS 8797]